MSNGDDDIQELLERALKSRKSLLPRAMTKTNYNIYRKTRTSSSSFSYNDVLNVDLLPHISPNNPLFSHSRNIPQFAPSKLKHSLFVESSMRNVPLLSKSISINDDPDEEKVEKTTIAAPPTHTEPSAPPIDADVISVHSGESGRNDEDMELEPIPQPEPQAQPRHAFRTGIEAEEEPMPQPEPQTLLSRKTVEEMSRVVADSPIFEVSSTTSDTTSTSVGIPQRLPNRLSLPAAQIVTGGDKDMLAALDEDEEDAKLVEIPADAMLQSTYSATGQRKEQEEEKQEQQQKEQQQKEKRKKEEVQEEEEKKSREGMNKKEEDATDLFEEYAKEIPKRLKDAYEQTNTILEQNKLSPSTNLAGRKMNGFSKNNLYVLVQRGKNKQIIAHYHPYASLRNSIDESMDVEGEKEFLKFLDNFVYGGMGRYYKPAKAIIYKFAPHPDIRKALRDNLFKVTEEEEENE